MISSIDSITFWQLELIKLVESSLLLHFHYLIQIFTLTVLPSSFCVLASSEVWGRGNGAVKRQNFLLTRPRCNSLTTVWWTFGAIRVAQHPNGFLVRLSWILQRTESFSTWPQLDPPCSYSTTPCPWCGRHLESSSLVSFKQDDSYLP